MTHKSSKKFDLDPSLEEEIYRLPKPLSGLSAEIDVLVLVRGADDKALNSRDEELLNKILEASNLPSETIHKEVLVEKETLGLAAVLPQISKVITFGLNPVDMGMQFRPMPYKVFQVAGAKWLMAHRLDQIAEEVDRKKALWSALKDGFIDS